MTEKNGQSTPTTTPAPRRRRSHATRRGAAHLLARRASQRSRWRSTRRRAPGPPPPWPSRAESCPCPTAPTEGRPSGAWRRRRRTFFLSQDKEEAGEKRGRGGGSPGIGGEGCQGPEKRETRPPDAKSEVLCLFLCTMNTCAPVPLKNAVSACLCDGVVVRGWGAGGWADERVLSGRKVYVCWMA